MAVGFTVVAFRTLTELRLRLPVAPVKRTMHPLQLAVQRYCALITPNSPRRTLKTPRDRTTPPILHR
jgi:hypothetical protein